MIIAFDGNVYAGKSSLIRTLSSLSNFIPIGEHAAFLPRQILDHSIATQERAQLLQSLYLDAEEARERLIDNRETNLLDRSFVSLAAHVFALTRVYSVDITEWFLQDVADRIERGGIAMPDTYYFVSCDHDVIRQRATQHPSRNTDPIYYNEKYLHAVDLFNTQWALRVGSTTIDTTKNLTLTLAESVVLELTNHRTELLAPQSVLNHLHDVFAQLSLNKGED